MEEFLVSFELPFTVLVLILLSSVRILLQYTFFKKVIAKGDIRERELHIVKNSITSSICKHITLPLWFTIDFEITCKLY